MSLQEHLYRKKPEIVVEPVEQQEEVTKPGPPRYKMALYPSEDRAEELLPVLVQVAEKFADLDEELVFDKGGVEKDFRAELAEIQLVVNRFRRPARVVVAFSTDQASLEQHITVAESKRPANVSAKWVEDPIGSQLSKYDSRIKVPSLRFWLFAPNWDDAATRLRNGHWLDPVLWNLGKRQKKQVAEFKRFARRHQDIEWHINVQNEYATAVLGDRLAEINPKSDEHVLNWGWCRTNEVVLVGGHSRFLCVRSDDGQLGVRWFWGGDDWGVGSVFSGGVKKA